MSNIKYDSDNKIVYDLDKMYNGKQKEEFLNYLSDNEGTQRTVAYIFYRSKEIEEQLGYDLANFSINYIGNVLKNIDAMNITVLKTSARFINAYLSWAIEEGRRNNNIHPMKDLSDDWYKGVLFQKKLYISKRELEENIIANLKNAQDEVILRLLFEGVYGHELSELINLEYKDINWKENKINLKETLKNGEIKVREEFEVSPECIDAIERAYEQESYFSKNGETKAKISSMPLLRTGYIIRTIDNKRSKSIKADRHIVYRRLDTISKLFNLPYLTAKNVQKSGMIKMSVDLYEEEGELGTEQLKKVAERFNLNKVNNNGFEGYNLSIVRQFINRDNIMELYEIDIED